MKVLKFLSFAVLAMCFAANLTASVGVIVPDEDGIVISTSSNGGSYDDSVNASVKSYKNSSDSEDWDAMLDSYEEYVDKYISLLKKASNGDMTAMTEYPALLNKAQEFSDKMKNAKGSMSASQWARYSQINMKMLKAAQEMR